MQPTESNFVNCHGDEWRFTFDRVTGFAALAGSDVDWKSFPVVDGVGYGLVLDRGERAWLRDAWAKATKDHPVASLYYGKETEFIQGKRSCSLSNDFCPICLRQRREFEVHHCIPAAQGGSDTACNLLRICNSCHAVITRGSVEDRCPMAMAALNHQLMYFGFQLFEDALTRPSRRSKTSFAEAFSISTQAVADMLKPDPTQRLAFDKRTKGDAAIEYKLMRDLGLGKWSWAVFEQRHLTPRLRDALPHMAQ